MTASSASDVPVITIDGPSGTGKGTLTRLLSEHLGWHRLDSGALYRISVIGAEKKGISLEDADSLSEFARTMDVAFPPGDDEQVLLEGQDVAPALRLESTGEKASRIAALPPLREALLARQRAFRQLPGLVADGRDMGTTVFPDAPLKLFLTASAEERAERRYKQLINKGVCVSLPTLLQDIRARDARDMQRSASPLVPAPDAITVDSTHSSIDEVLAQVMVHVGRAFPELLSAN